MTVYVVMGVEGPPSDLEGFVIGVFSTLERAHEVMKERGGVDVHAWGLDHLRPLAWEKRGNDIVMVPYGEA